MIVEFHLNDKSPLLEIHMERLYEYQWLCEDGMRTQVSASLLMHGGPRAATITRAQPTNKPYFALPRRFKLTRFLTVISH